MHIPDGEHISLKKRVGRRQIIVTPKKIQIESMIVPAWSIIWGRDPCQLQENAFIVDQVCMNTLDYIGD